MINPGAYKLQNIKEYLQSILQNQNKVFYEGTFLMCVPYVFSVYKGVIMLIINNYSYNVSWL